MSIVDRFDGWLVMNHEALKAAFAKLPPHYRKYKTIRKELGINPQQLADFLEGRRYPSLLNFKKLCLYLQISADDLLGLSSIKESSSK
jgi:transcriptional regulator with XRE-family HTH domain